MLFPKVFSMTRGSVMTSSPEIRALVLMTGRPQSAAMATGAGWAGILTPTSFLSVMRSLGMIFLALRTKVKGPGRYHFTMSKEKSLRTA